MTCTSGSCSSTTASAVWDLSNQVLCSRYSSPGDSGSLVVDKKTKRAVGLHFAGAPHGSVFSPIGEVLKALGAQLVTRKIG